MSDDNIMLVQDKNLHFIYIQCDCKLTLLTLVYVSWAA